MYWEKDEVYPYRLKHTIEKGLFYKIKVAQHIFSQKHVVAVIVFKKKLSQHRQVVRFYKWRRIAKSVDHPNFIKVIDTGDDSDKFCIFMEYPSLGDFTQIMQRYTPRMSERHAHPYFLQIIDGIEYLHRKNLAHRDIRPQNIYLTENGVVKIGNFRLCFSMQKGIYLKTDCGQQNYRAPQIITSQYEGKAVDIWSTGIILYQLIVGRRPFQFEYASTMIAAMKCNMYVISEGYFDFPPHVSPHAKDLISKMLDINPKTRITIHQIQAHPWVAKKMPIYRKMSGYYSQKVQKVKNYPYKRIDQEILRELILYQYDQGLSEKTLREAIKDQWQCTPSVSTYYMLKYQKDDKMYAEFLKKKHPKYHIFIPIQNKRFQESPSVLKFNERKYKYGKFYQKSLEELCEVMFDTSRQYQVNHIEKKKEPFTYTCTYKTTSQVSSSKSLSQSQENPQNSKQQISQKPQKITFTAKIYKANGDKPGHVLDLMITSGHPLIFLKLIEKIQKH